MKRILLVGITGSGKTSLSQALQGQELAYRKTQAVSFYPQIIDTPGEYLENRRYYSALLASSVNCQTIALVQDATRSNSLFPPRFASMFNKEVVGVVSKIDHSQADCRLAEKFLRWAGAETIILTSAVSGIGVEELRHLMVT